LVVSHLLDVVHERPDRLKEAPELGALTEAREMSLLGVPLDPNDALAGVLAAARDLVTLAVLG